MAVSTVDEKWLIDRLDGKNWMTWKFQMRHLLLGKELWGFVHGWLRDSHRGHDSSGTS